MAIAIALLSVPSTSTTTMLIPLAISSVPARRTAPTTPSSSSRPPLMLSPRAASNDSPPPETPAPQIDDSDFDSRLARLQRKVTSGSGKKAEKRKARKEGAEPSSYAKSSKGSVLLPPVSLTDPISDGLKVELGFNSYTERLNGRFAALGLAAVLLVELATGGSFIKYHESATLGVQAYFMLAVSALYIKYEKEKASIWPKS